MSTRDLKAAAQELKAKLRAEFEQQQAKQVEHVPSESKSYSDFDSQDWGRTESEDKPEQELSSEIELPDALTASDEALMADLRAEPDPDEGTTSELTWPEDEVPAAKAPTPKPESEPEPEPEPLPPAQAAAALRAELSNRSRDTTLMALAKKGVKNVKVLGMNTIEKIVERAVSTAIERSTVARSIAERDALEQDARKEFYKLLKRHKKVLAEQTQGAKQRDDLVSQLREMQEERARAEQALKHEQQQSGPNLSPDAIKQLESSFHSLLIAFMTDERRKLIVADDPKALAGLSELEKKLGGVFDRLLDRVKSEAEELLERRISKLNQALEETETALRHLAQSKGYDDGIASIYDSVQGLDLSDLDYERKKGLLSIVFVENLQIQEREVTDEDRKMYSDALDQLGLPKEEPAADLSAPSGFAAPLPTPTTDVAF